VSVAANFTSFVQRPVIAALSFQGVSLFVGVASVPVLLVFLSAEDFVAWILIATFGALTIQIEQGIQVVASRRLARHWHSGDTSEFSKELVDIQCNFQRFSLAVFFGLGTIGFLYFGALADLDLSPNWPYAWFFFILSYSLNYWFGYNNAILLATESTSYFNLTNALTRSVNFVLTLLLLWQGLSILGLALSFLAAVCLSVLIQRRKARVQIAAMKYRLPTAAIPARGGPEPRPTVAYTVYTLSNFFLYKGAFLAFPLLPGSHDIASYGLALQLVAILYAISIIPTQVWLHRLVTAFLDRDRRGVTQNLSASLAFCFAVFAACFLAVVLLARPVLGLIGSEVDLPSNAVIGVIFLCFLVEAVIFLFVNLLLVFGETRFLWHYTLKVWIVLALCCIIQNLFPTMGIAVVFLLVPLTVQTLTTLPVAILHALRSVRMNTVEPVAHR